MMRDDDDDDDDEKAVQVMFSNSPIAILYALSPRQRAARSHEDA